MGASVSKGQDYFGFGLICFIVRGPNARHGIFSRRLCFYSWLDNGCVRPPGNTYFFNIITFTIVTSFAEDVCGVNKVAKPHFNRGEESRIIKIK